MRKIGFTDFFIALFILGLFSTLNTFATQDYWNGEDYFKNSSSQKDAATDLMKYVSINGNENILDVGCGDGKITAEIASKYPKCSIIGLDISESMIDFAQKTFSQKQYPNLHFALKDAQDLDYNAEFDIIFSFTALQWLKNHDEFLKAANASLKPSGILAITMPLGPPQALEQAVNEVISLPEWSSYFQQFSTGWNFVKETEYAQLLLAHQFTIIRFEVVPQKDIFPSRESFEIFLGQIFPYLRALPQNLKKTFLTQVVHRFIDLESPFSNGEVHWKFLRLEVVAKKIKS